MSPRLLAQFPEEMTIVLQHQFWDLTSPTTGFEVGMSFGGIPERLGVPFAAIKGFVDPSVQFGLQFEKAAEDGAEATAPQDADAPAKSRHGAARAAAGGAEADAPTPTICHHADAGQRRRPRPAPTTGPTSHRAAARSCGSTASARNRRERCGTAAPFPAVAPSF